jgi:predicted nucleotidyltransferase
MNGEILLQGIVGSTAYGFATENSDVDRLGLYASPTILLHGLGEPKESYVTTKPDLTLHEARKWCRLALKCNPTAMELVWLPDDLYDIRTALGDELIAIRRSFLSAKAVRNSYLGYATSQLTKMKHAHKQEARYASANIGADSRDRQHKHARHLVRLVLQGIELHQGGDLIVRLPAPNYVVETANTIVQDPKMGDLLMRGAESVFDEPSMLPDEPNADDVQAWLHRVRRAMLE